MSIVETVETTDMKYLKLAIPDELHPKFKGFCAVLGTSMQARIIELISNDVSKVDKVNIANTVDNVGTVNNVDIAKNAKTVDDLNTVNTVAGQLNKMQEQIDELRKNYWRSFVPASEFTPTEQNTEESDRLITEEENLEIKSSLIIQPDSEPEYHINSDESSDSEKKSKPKKERKKRPPIPETITPGTKLLPNQLTKRLSDYQISLGKKPLGSGTLINNRKNMANSIDPNYHQNWIRERDPDGILWEYDVKEKIYLAIALSPKRNDL